MAPLYINILYTGNKNLLQLAENLKFFMETYFHFFLLLFIFNSFIDMRI